jgi:hypothetical protein
MKQLLIFLSILACLFLTHRAAAAFAFPVTHKNSNGYMEQSKRVKVSRFIALPSDFTGAGKKVTAKGWVQFSLLENSNALMSREEKNVYPADIVASVSCYRENLILFVIDIFLFMSLMSVVKFAPSTKAAKNHLL